MSKFNPGDRVVFNKSQIATIHTYNEEAGLLVLEQEVGGSSNLIYGPISSYELELLVAAAVTEAVEPDPVPESHKPVPSFNDDNADEFVALDKPADSE